MTMIKKMMNDAVDIDDDDDDDCSELFLWHKRNLNI